MDAFRRLFPLLCVIVALAGVYFVICYSSAEAVNIHKQDPLSNTGTSIIVSTLEDELNTDGDCSLREAITAANSNSVIDKCPAGIIGVINTISFSVGGTISLWEQLPEIPNNSQVVIDGDGKIIINGKNTDGFYTAKRIILVAPGGDLSIKNIIVEDSNNFPVLTTRVHNDSSDYIGGCIYIMSGGKLFVKDSTIQNCYSVDEGGAIYSDGQLIIEGGQIINNVTGACAGGGIENRGSLTMTNTLVENNDMECRPWVDYMGGSGINSVYSATLTNVVLRNNHVLDCVQNTGTMEITGGIVSGNYRGISNRGGNISLTNTKIVSNKRSSFSNYSGNAVLTNVVIANNTGSNGVGIYNGGDSQAQASLFLTNVSIEDNATDCSEPSGCSGGGLLNDAYGFAQLSGVTIKNNYAYFDGGGIKNSGVISLENVTISGNSTHTAGGGIANFGSGSLTNVTISDNSATNGGGIWSYSGTPGNLTLKNTILSNNVPGNCSEKMPFSNGYNISSDDTCNLVATEDKNSVNPVIGPLADNGGSTLSHIPLPRSPAINEGQCVQGINIDQRWLPRPSGPECDVGAVEVQPSDSWMELFVPMILQ